MTRRAALVIALVAVGAALGIAFAWSRHEAIAESGHESRPAAPSKAHAHSSLAAPAATHSAPDLAHIESDPEAAAAAWQARAEDVVIAKDAKRFGPEVARLVAEAPDRAWAALTARAHDGDVNAATAAMLVAIECRNLPAMLEAPRHVPKHPELSPPWQAFVAALDRAQRRAAEDRAARCAGVGGIWDFAIDAIDRFVRSDDPHVRLDAVDDEPDDEAAIAELRDLAGTLDDDGVRRKLAYRLIRAQSPDHQSEGHALLELLAEDNADAAALLADCFRNGCGAFHGDPAEADGAVEHAAALGVPWTLHDQIERLAAAHRDSEAWAWSLYALELARDGCFEYSRPTTFPLAQAAADAERTRTQLSPAEQNAGRALSYAIAGRWGLATKERLGCAD